MYFDTLNYPTVYKVRGEDVGYQSPSLTLLAAMFNVKLPPSTVGQWNSVKQRDITVI